MTAHGHRAGDPPLTVEDYERLPEEQLYRLELDRGRVVREPRPGLDHQWLAARFIGRLLRYAEDAGGIVLTEAGFVLSDDPATVRIPDVAYVSEDRLPDEGVPRGMGRMAPDLAIEIVSPSNTASEMEAKLVDYFDAGVRMVWLVYPMRRHIAVYRSGPDAGIERLIAGATLDGGEVLPGFRLALKDLFGD